MLAFMLWFSDSEAHLHEYFNVSLLGAGSASSISRRLSKSLLVSPSKNEYRQYMRSISPGEVPLHRALLTATNRGEHFSYDVDVDTDISGMVIIRLREYGRKGNLTRGGSSFLVSRVPGARCWLTDNANGTYTGACPPSKYVGCLPLIVRRQSVWFALYRVKMNPLDLVLVNRTVCLTKPASREDYEFYQLTEPATWTVDHYNLTRITHHYGLSVTLLDKAEICKRLALRYDHVSTMGASHTRYNFDYLLTNCFRHTELNSLKRKHVSFAIGNIDFKLSMFASDFKQNAVEEFADFNITSSSLFLLQFGAHDLNSFPYNKPMGGHMQLFMQSVERLCRAGVKVVVLATPPFPDHNHDMSKRHMRNNYALAAFNFLLSSRISALKVCYTRIYNIKVGVIDIHILYIIH